MICILVFLLPPATMVAFLWIHLGAYRETLREKDHQWGDLSLLHPTIFSGAVTWIFLIGRTGGPKLSHVLKLNLLVLAGAWAPFFLLGSKCPG